jgi:hypothetical protein
MPTPLRPATPPAPDLTLATVTLRLRADGLLTPPGAESVAEQVQRLQNEAHGLAREHIAALERALETVYRLSTEVKAGGAVYDIDVRDVAERVAEKVISQRQTIGVLMQRNPPPRG